MNEEWFSDVDAVQASVGITEEAPESPSVNGKVTELPYRPLRLPCSLKPRAWQLSTLWMVLLDLQLPHSAVQGTSFHTSSFDTTSFCWVRLHVCLYACLLLLIRRL